MFVFLCIFVLYCRSQWPRGLRRRSSAARLLRLWVRIPPGAWMSVCCECCVLSGRGLCDELITRPGESYRLWRVVCDQETSKTRRLKPATGLWNYNHRVVTPRKQTNIRLILCLCVVLCITSPFIHSCIFPICLQVYQPLPPGGNPIAANKYHIPARKSAFVTPPWHMAATDPFHLASNSLFTTRPTCRWYYAFELATPLNKPHIN